MKSVEPDGGPSPQRAIRDNRIRIRYLGALVRHAPTQVRSELEVR